MTDEEALYKSLNYVRTTSMHTLAEIGVSKNELIIILEELINLYTRSNRTSLFSRRCPFCSEPLFNSSKGRTCINDHKI